MAAHLTVAVLGPIPFDRVTTLRGDALEKYDCALDTVAALSALRSPLVEYGWSCTCAGRTNRRSEDVGEVSGMFLSGVYDWSEVAISPDGPFGGGHRLDTVTFWLSHQSATDPGNHL